MASLQETLQRLAQGFVARDIMVPLERLTRADDEAAAAHKLEENLQYDIIPMPQKGRLTAFLERGATRVKIIQIQHVVSAETPILDLLSSLCDQRHIFVVGRHEVIGLVHFSDLNDPIVKLPFFVLLEGLERQVVDAIRPLVSIGKIKPLFTRAHPPASPVSRPCPPWTCPSAAPPPQRLVSSGGAEPPGDRQRLRGDDAGAGGRARDPQRRHPLESA
jgi:hypothetical protein